MARVSGARFVWPCSLARMMLLEDALSTYSGVIGSRRRNPYKVKQGMKPDTCQGNKFVLGCTNVMVQLALWCQVGKGREPILAVLIFEVSRIEASLTLPP